MWGAVWKVLWNKEVGGRQTLPNKDNGFGFWVLWMLPLELENSMTDRQKDMLPECDSPSWSKSQHMDMEEPPLQTREREWTCSQMCTIINTVARFHKMNRCQTASHPSLLDMYSNGQRSYVQYGQTYVRIYSKQITIPQFLQGLKLTCHECA